MAKKNTRQTPRPRKRTLALPSKKGHPITKTVSVVRKNNRTGEVLSEEEDCETSLSEHIINPAHVSVGLSATKNLGDFESAKVSVMLSRPCLDTPEDIERVYQESADWVDTKVIAELSKV